MRFLVRYKNPGPLKPKANPYPSRAYPFKKGSGILTCLLILSIATVFRFSPSFYNTLRPVLFEGIALMQKVFMQPFQEVHFLLKESYATIHLKQEYARLTEENKALKWRLQLLEPLQHENMALRQSLSVPFDVPYKHLTVRIIASPYDGIHRFFLIKGGTEEGLEKNQAVVSPEGILGRIEKTGHHVARVLLLNDINSRIPVMIEGSNQKAILAGEGGFFPILMYIADVQKVQQGEKVVTSGLGGIFPPGLPVGYIEKTTNGKIYVRPYASLQNLEWVRVLSLQPKSLMEDVQTNLERE